MKSARAAGAESAPAQACLLRAARHLGEAESLVAGGPRGFVRAELLAQLSQAEANCAISLQSLKGEAEQGRSIESTSRSEAEERARRIEAEQHRLEERVALLQRNLDMTETELIRTKARLKGTETRADASSAVAEARVLMRRAVERGRSPGLALCQEKLERSEQLLEEGNYGAAQFFALQAQELLDGLQRGPATEADRPPIKKSYTVAVAQANLRSEPKLQASIVERLPKGATLEAQAVRGEWVRVAYEGKLGWIARSLLE